MRSEPLQEAILAAGSVTALARAIGIAPQAISQWERVPAERVLEVERVTRVPRGRLRPDLYPSERKDSARPTQAQDAAE
jgi:DNA-binding transcriptional regulator YdaS (Cro superfamily)